MLDAAAGPAVRPDGQPAAAGTAMILSVATNLPGGRLTSAELAERYGISEEWIVLDHRKALRVINGNLDATSSENIYVLYGQRTFAIRTDRNSPSYATYLAFTPARVGPDFRAEFESSVDRADLVKTFVHGPAAPLNRLLPGGANDPHSAFLNEGLRLVKGGQFL